MPQRTTAPSMQRTCQIGPVTVQLSSPHAGILEDYTRLYLPHFATAKPRATFRLHVAPRRSRRTARRFYHILSPDGETQIVRRREQVIPHVEGALNLQIARYFPDDLLLHAAVLERDGVGLLCPGHPGAGKTTLTAALITRGWRYASDEFAMIDPDTLINTPYPKALCIKSGSVAALRDFGTPVECGLGFQRVDKGKVLCLPPRAIRPDAVAPPSNMHAIIFPEHADGATPALAPISRAQAAFFLTRFCFNFYKFRRQAVETLVAIARRAVCFRLRTGHLPSTVACVESAVADIGRNARRCA